ncbi:ABC transporter substrate-binding protein [Streptomyces sp. NPDC020845]|uniref:ABC transporter substrate-binding protein n=1 Tax=Streptomyces sp. NPDC020845 TaxID=3365096 RepID=UPI003794D274
MHRRLIAALAIAALAAAGCSTSAPGSQGAGSQSDATRGVTADSVKVGGLIVKTSSYGASNAATEIGAKARFDRANAEGGVNGRKIEFIGAEDDGADQAKDIAAARKLVQQKQVFAVVPVSTFMFAGAKFLQQQNVPYFGWGYSAPEWCGPEVAFSFDGCTGSTKPGPQSAGFFTSLVKATGPAKGRSVAVIGHDDAVTKAVNKIAKASATSLGFKVVSVQNTVPQTSVPTDWSPYVNRLVTSDGGKAPDIIFSTMATPFNAGLFGALKDAGFKGTVLDGISYSDSTLKNPQVRKAFEGAYVSAPIEPLASDSAAAKQMRTDLEKATGKKNFEWSQDMGVGYATADVFLQVLQKAGTDLTVDSFLKAAQNITIKSPYGGNVSFPADRTAPNGCQSLLRVKNGHWKLAAPLVCKTFNFTG